jgi:peroxiredoxin
MLMMLIMSFVAFAAPPTYSGADLFSKSTVQAKPGPKGLVLIFLSAKCPCSNSHTQMIKNLATEFKQFNFVGVHANSDEDLKSSQAYFKSLALPFPIIEDSEQQLADQLGALKTPHSFLISPEGKILYQGGVTSSHQADQADKQYLREALAETQAGKTVTVSEARTLGCVISRGKQNVW